jgi:VanZ family protein
VAVLWTLVILAACSIPGQDLPDIEVFSIDKVAHFTVFAVFGWLWMYASRAPLRTRVIRVLAAGIAYAVLTELYQGLLPWERTPDVYDALADAVGAVAGVLVYARASRAAPKSPAS